MKFKGKGYYVYKNFRHTLAPQFGYYHKIYVYAFNVSVKFLSKTSVLLFGLSKNDLLTVGYDFRSKKPMNIFTGRGVRFSRQVVYKKTGKVSSYR
jgi:ribosomal protein L6P/L9E